MVRGISTPLADTLTSAVQANSFANFDYSAALWRFGCSGCSNYLEVCGTPTPLQTQSTWNRGLRFQYSRNGMFSVWKDNGGTFTTLQNFTATAAINQGDAWNVLRVVGNGSTFSFYINGTLVWQGTDTSFSAGRVGIGRPRRASSQVIACTSTMPSSPTVRPDRERVGRSAPSSKR